MDLEDAVDFEAWPHWILRHGLIGISQRYKSDFIYNLQQTFDKYSMIQFRLPQITAPGSLIFK